MNILYKEGSWLFIEQKSLPKSFFYISHCHHSLPPKSRRNLLGYNGKCFCGLTPPDAMINLCTMLNMEKPRMIFWHYRDELS